MKRWAWALAAALTLTWLLLRFTPFPVQRLEGDWSWAAVDADGGLLRVGLNSSGAYRLPMTLEDSPPGLLEAWLAVEDRWFWVHPGIDPVAALRAAYQNWRAKRVVSGASTITMQLARLMEPRRRTLRAKVWQAYRAMQIEARYSKRRILELYLSRVPMGGNLEGVPAAAWLYFGRPPAQLSAGECAFLIALPRSPRNLRPDRDPAAAEAGRRRILRRLEGRWPAAWKGQDPWDVHLPGERLPNPYRAPHMLERLAPRLRGRPGLSRLALQPGVQGRLESRLAATVAGLKRRGVRHGAVLVVNNRDRSVIGYVGSPEPGSRDAGRVNGAGIERSPGSTLKPLLYGLALDQGLLTPHSVLYDIPRDYGGYRPSNYGGVYAGPVTAEDALTRSLNTPAVWLESQLVGRGGGGLAALLGRLGIVAPGRNPVAGLALVLGAQEMNLEQLVMLYAAMADGGTLRPLRYFSDEGLPPATGKVFSGEAAYLVAQMLSNGQRPDLPNSWEFTTTRGRVAFKTGTSFGFRDAWCLAYSPSYTVGVWLGNADGRGSPALLGAKAAAPLAVELMNQLLARKDEWFTRPPGVQMREVCSLTGLSPGPDCRDLSRDDAIVGVSSTFSCRVHRRVWVRRADGKRLAPDCLKGDPSQYRQQRVEAWPPDVSLYLRTYGAATLPYPPPAEDCPELAGLLGPKMISPAKGSLFELKEGMATGTQRLPLRAQASPDVERLYWFVDGALVADVAPEETGHWLAAPGKHRVSVVDSEGRSAANAIVVRGPRLPAAPEAAVE